MRPKGRILEGCHTNVPSWRGVLSTWRAAECSIRHLTRSVSILGARLIVCLISTLSEKKKKKSLTDWLVVGGWLSFPRPISHICWKPPGFVELEPVTAAVTCVVGLSVSVCVCVSVLWGWGDAEEERFCLMARTAVSQCFIPFAHVALPHVIVSSRR